MAILIKPDRKSILSVGIIYLVLVVLLAASTPSFSERLIGNNIDSWIFYWNDWWLRTAYAEGVSLFFTDRIFAPHGTSLVLHSSSFATSFFAFLIEKITGPIIAYNVVLMSGLWVGSLGMFCLVYAHTEDPASSFVAGIIYSFAPYHITQLLAHAHLGTIHWWPWFLLAFLGLLETRKWKYVVWASVFAALTFWSGLQLAILLAFLAIFYLLTFIVQQGIRKVPIYHLLLTGALVVIFCSPYLIQIFNNRDAVFSASSAYNEGSLKQTDLLSYVTPPTYHPIWGEAFIPIYEKLVANRAFVPFLGFIPLMIIFWGGVRNRKVRVWLAGLSIWVMFSLGNELRVGGQVTQITLPYNLIGDVFPFSTLRSPDRFNLLVVFSLSMAVGLALSHQIKNRRYLVFGVISILILGEYLMYPLFSLPLPEPSPFHEALAIDNAGESIFDYPAGYTNSKRWLYYQTIHQQPTVEGHLSRFDEDTYQFVIATPLAQALYKNAGRPVGIDIPDLVTMPATVDDLDDFLNNNVRFVVHHRDYSSIDQKAHLYDVLPYVPAYKDNMIEVFDLKNLTPFTLIPENHSQPLVAEFNSEIVLNKVSWERINSELHFSLNWFAVEQPADSYKVFLHVTDADGALVGQYDGVPCNWQCPTHTWGKNSEIEDQAFIDFYGLPEGEYRLDIGLYRPDNGERLKTSDGLNHTTLGKIQLSK